MQGAFLGPLGLLGGVLIIVGRERQWGHQGGGRCRSSGQREQQLQGPSLGEALMPVISAL